MPAQIPPSSAFIRAFLLSAEQKNHLLSDSFCVDPRQAHPHHAPPSRYRLALYDRRSASEDLKHHILVGSVRFSLLDIVDARSRVDLPLLASNPISPATTTASPPSVDTRTPRSSSKLSDMRKHVARSSSANERTSLPCSSSADSVITSSDNSNFNDNNDTDDNSVPNNTCTNLPQPVRVTLRAVLVNEELYAQRRRVVFEIALPVARGSEPPYTSLNQVVEISYADQDPQMDGRKCGMSARRSWLPLYRSESLRDNHCSDGNVSFQPIVLPEWRLGALDRDLRIRILLFDSRSRSLRAAAVAVTSLTRLQEMDPLTDIVPIMSVEANDDSALNCLQLCPHLPSQNPHQQGYFVLLSAEPASFGGIFKLRAVYSMRSNSPAYNADSTVLTSRLSSDRDSFAAQNALPSPYLSYTSSDCTGDHEYSADDCSDDQESSIETCIHGDSDYFLTLKKPARDTYTHDAPGVINVAGVMLPDRADKSRERGLRTDLQDLAHRANSPSHLHNSKQDLFSSSYTSWSPITPLRPRSPSNATCSPGARARDRSRSPSPRNGYLRCTESGPKPSAGMTGVESRGRPNSMSYVTGMRASFIPQEDVESSSSQRACLLVRKSSQPLTCGLGKRATDRAPRQYSAPNYMALHAKQQEALQAKQQEATDGRLENPKMEKRRGLFRMVRFSRALKTSS